MPLSDTVKTSCTLPRRAGLQVTSSRTLPRSVNFTALSIRFSSAARNRSGSPITASGSSLEIIRLGLEPFGFGARRQAKRRAPRAKRCGRMSSRRSTRPLASARAASTTSDVSMARCSAVLLIALAQPRSRSPSPELASSSPSARIPVSGVRISCARSAKVASIARACARGGIRRRGRLARRERLPSGFPRFRHLTPRADCHGARQPATTLIPARPFCAYRRDRHRSPATRARRLRASISTVFRRRPPGSSGDGDSSAQEDQAGIAAAGACWSPRTGPARARRGSPLGIASSTTTER